MPGYMIEYLLQTDIPGAKGDKEFEATVRDFMPPSIMSRWRNATNGKLSGKRTRLGFEVEKARTCTFITEERSPALDLAQWDGDHMFNFYSVMLDDTDGLTWGEYHRVAGEVADVETGPAQADGGQDYTYSIYVSDWEYRDVPGGIHPNNGWLIKKFDFLNDRYHERLVGSGSGYRGYIGAPNQPPLLSPGAYREMVKNHEILLGRT